MTNKKCSNLYTEWQRLSKLAKELHDDFDEDHHRWITSDNEVETRERLAELNETKQHLIKIRTKAGETYDKYLAVK